MSTWFVFVDGHSSVAKMQRFDSGFHHLAVAVNLSPSHHFLGFINQSVDTEGNIDYRVHETPDSDDRYHVYNRFPPGSFALIKLVTLPFDDLLSQVIVAQILMLVFSTGTAVLAYWSLCRLTPSRWIALTATFVVFSSSLVMLYSGAVIVDVGPDLFGFVLVFHGMVLFVQEGRFSQLVVKSCIALLLGWHVLALLFVFIFLGLIKETIRIHTSETLREIIVTVATSPYFVLGAIALGFGLLILTYNMGVEYYALNATGTYSITLSDLPSIRSALSRTGVAEGLSGGWSWDQFLFRQVRRLSQTIAPFALSNLVLYSVNSFSSFAEPVFSSLNMGWMIRSPEFYLGILAIGACMVGMFRVRHRLLVATAVLSGFFWAIPMHNNTNKQPYESIYYVGISLFFCTLILLLVQKLMGDWFMVFVAGLGLLIFAFSSYQIDRVEYRNEFSAEFKETIIDDFDTIVPFTREGRNVFVPMISVPMISDIWANDNYRLTRMDNIEFGGARFGLHYFLSGSRILFNAFGCDRSLGWADFMVRTRRDVGPGLLTPDNEVVFLYDRRVHEEYVDSLVEGGVLVVRGDFDVYLTEDRRLVYVSDRCDGVGSGLFLGVPISLSIYPVDAADLPDPERGHEFRELAYIEHFVLDARRHVVIFDLPDYGIARVDTGQYGEGGRIWGGSFFGPEHEPDAGLLARADRAAVGGGAVARGRFDVYLVDGSLLYVKKPCRGADVSDGFFVHVVPVDGGDLPEHRRELGFENLDFVFFDRGTSDGVRCAAEIGLPGYDIARVTTGQYNDRGRTWQNEIHFSR